MESGIPFVTTYHPKVNELGILIKKFKRLSHLLQLYLPAVREKRNIIVRSKLYPVERKVGCQGCGCSRYQVCKSISITEEFTSFTTKKPIK